MGQRGLAVGISSLANGLLQEARERKRFSQRLQEAVFMNELAVSRADRVAQSKARAKSAPPLNGPGSKQTGKEERLLDQMEQAKRNEAMLAEKGIKGAYIPQVPGMRFEQGKTGRSKPAGSGGYLDQMYGDLLDTGTESADPIQQKVQELRSQGMSDPEIAKFMREKGMNPQDYGVNG